MGIKMFKKETIFGTTNPNTYKQKIDVKVGFGCLKTILGFIRMSLRATKNFTIYVSGFS